MGFRIKVLILAAVLLLGVAGAAFASGKLPANLGSVAGLGGPETSASGDDSAVEGQYAGYEDDEDEAVAGESATADGYGTDDDATEVDDETEVDDDDATEVEDDEDEIDDDDDESNVTPPVSGNTAYSRDDGDDEDEADDDSTSLGTVGSGSGGSGVSSTGSASGSDGQTRHNGPEPRERD